VAIPSELIGSITTPLVLIEAARAFQFERISQAELYSHYESAVQDTVAGMDATGSPVVTDGEQGTESFVTYPTRGLNNVAADGIAIPFADGRHTLRLLQHLAADQGAIPS